MLILIRLATAVAIFAVLFCVLFFGSLVIGGAIVGARAVSKPGMTAAQRHEAARQAGEDFGRNYVIWLFLGSFFGSGIVAIILPFVGVLPWCRPPKPPGQIN